MFRWNNKDLKIFLWTIITIIVSPIIIHILFKIDFGVDFFYATWSSGDILQYIGTVLTAILATEGVYFTIKENKISTLQNKIIENKPYLKTKITYLLNFVEKEKLKENNNIVCIWDKEGTKSINLCNIEGKQRLSEYNEKNDINRACILKLDICNIGLGNAMSLEFKMCNNNFFPKTIICRKECLVLYIIVNKDIITSVEGALEFVYKYDDILNINTYEQKEKIYITYDKKGKRYLLNKDFEDEISEPYIVNSKI